MPRSNVDLVRRRGIHWNASRLGQDQGLFEANKLLKYIEPGQRTLTVRLNCVVSKPANVSIPCRLAKLLKLMRYLNRKRYLDPADFLRLSVRR